MDYAEYADKLICVAGIRIYMRLYFPNPHKPHAEYAGYAHVRLSFPNPNILLVFVY